MPPGQLRRYEKCAQNLQAVLGIQLALVAAPAPVQRALGQAAEQHSERVIPSDADSHEHFCSALSEWEHIERGSDLFIKVPPGLGSFAILDIYARLQQDIDSGRVWADSSYARELYSSTDARVGPWIPRPIDLQLQAYFPGALQLHVWEQHRPKR